MITFDWQGRSITVCRLFGRVAVEINGQPMAYVDVEAHAFWAWNPGLREEVIKRINAYTLVGVPS